MYDLKQKEEELKNISFVKTILMIIIVLYHSIIFWGGSWFTQDPAQQIVALKWLSEWMNTFHIYGFTLASGYLYAYVRHERGKYQSFKVFLQKKVTRLLVPYFCVALLWVVPIQCYFIDYTAEELISKYLLATAPSQLWFLIMLFGVSLFFRLFSDVIYNNNKLGLTIVLIMYMLGSIGSVLLPNIFGVWTICRHILLFWIGFKIRQYGSNMLYKGPIAVWIVVDVALFIVYKVVAMFDGIFFKMAKLGLLLILYVLGAMMSFFVLQKLAQKVRWEKNKVFELLSQNSMGIYLLHQQIIYFTISSFNGILSPYLNILINFVCALLGALFISMVLKKNKWTRKLIGE